MKKVLISHFLPVLLLILLGASIFTPIYGDLGHRVLGNITSYNSQDGYQNIWNFWWAKKNCLGFCGNMWHTNYQYYPTGTSLLFETWAYPSLYLFTPLMFFGLEAVTVYNLALIFAVIASLLAAYALVYHLTKKRTAAFIGAIIYGLSQFIVGHLLDGQLNLSNIQFFPLFLLFLLKAKENKGRLFPILAGATLLLLGLNDYVFLLLAFMVWLIYIIYNYLADRVNFRAFIQKNLFILLVFLVPFIALSFNNFRELNNFELSGPTKWDANYSAANLASFVTPPNYTLLGKTYFAKSYTSINGIFSDKAIYLGLIPTLLAALGIFYLRKRKELWLWLSLGLASFALSLGPSLHIVGNTFNFWLPFKVVQLIPILNIIRAPSRFTVIISLSLAILAGYGTCLLKEKFSKKYVFATIFIAACFLILLEIYPINMPETDLYMPQGYREIMKDTSDFAILESPALWMSGLRNVSNYYPIETLYFQTIHGKKIANGYVTRVDKDLLDAYADQPLVKFLVTQSKNPNSSSPLEDTLSRYVDIYKKNLLADNPYKYLVMIKAPDWTSLNTITKKTFADHLVKFYEDDEVEIYTFK
jgi:hypothetical protein